MIERGRSKIGGQVRLIQNFGPLYHYFTSNGIGHYSWVPLLWKVDEGKADQRVSRETYSGRNGWAKIEGSSGGRR
jgi:hypothetical protein